MLRRTRPHPMHRRPIAVRLGRGLLVLVVLAAISAASIEFSLRVTPAQSVTVLGQTVDVTTTWPTAGLSGPGELDLFGQALPTRVRFAGPVRPRLVLSNITVNSQVEGWLRSGRGRPVATVIGDRLAEGWRRYFAWEVGFVALGAALLLLLVAGWRRWSWRRTVAAGVVGLVVVQGVNLGLIMVTAFTAPRILANVHSLSQLVGQAKVAPITAPAGPPLQGVQAVVIGDSTAAGLGNPPSSDATAAARACGRSTDSYAVDLARVNGWTVANLACSAATIRHGLLGPQDREGRRLPPQVAVARRAVDASAVIVSIGANDLGWGDLIRLCAVGPCNDRASQAFFQKSLNRFIQNYYDLLQTLGDLPGHPRVVVNLYYRPFTPSVDCFSRSGLTPGDLSLLLGRLGALNSVLADGARTFGDTAVQPDFAGHELCSPEPWLQGLGGAAPFHPNAEGELAIALADERALRAEGRAVGPSPSSSPTFTAG